ncbi:MAG: PIN domain-containing protein [Acidobacteriaceae bacterium]
MIVVLDTSVWISALEFGGIPDLALVRALTVDQVAISDFIRTEIMRVLTGKFARDPAELEGQLDELLVQAFLVEVTGEITGVCCDPNDNAILETAWKARQLSCRRRQGSAQSRHVRQNRNRLASRLSGVPVA